MSLDRILDRFFGGHFNIGPVTVYGRNAMHFAVQIRTRRWGYVSFRLPLFCFGQWWPLYIHASPNATPWAATFYVGGGRRNIDRALAPLRRHWLGHNFNDDENMEMLRRINALR